MRHISRPTARYAGAVVLVLAVPPVLSLLFGRIVDGVVQGSDAFPWWLLQFGTIGQTVVAYSLFLSVLSSVVVPLLTFYLGYRYGTRRTDPSTARS